MDEKMLNTKKEAHVLAHKDILKMIRSRTRKLT